MVRVPEQCTYRTMIVESAEGLAVCGALRLITGVSDPGECRVRRDVCVACCLSFRGPDEVNPVLASLMYTMAARIIASAGHPECGVAQASILMQRATDQLSVIVRELPDQNFPANIDSNGQAAESRTARFSPTFQWATAMLTAPRREPTIEQTLHSLKLAGFDNVHIFAEPGARIPDCCRHFRITQRPQQFGNFLNFYSCLTTLLSEHPTADAYAVFQDDIELASGLKDWFEDECWPLNNGVVSLFTPRLHSESAVGWQLKCPGSQRVCGAQALVFRTDMLQRFLSDTRVLHSLRLRDQGDDAVLGGWLAREGLDIAYHTPSLVQHVGTVSSIYPNGHDLRNLAHAVQAVSEIPQWTLPAQPGGRIGLVGWNVPSGLGSINRDLARQLEVTSWLAPPHPWLAESEDRVVGGFRTISEPGTREVQEKWCSELDWLLFAERPYLEHLPRLAAHRGVGIACLPMWEWVQPDLPWLQFVDVMICPTLHTWRLMEDWKRRYGFGWKIVHVPWPVDASRFAFRQRKTCREFLFVNGWGGGEAHRPDGSPVAYRRKGLELIIAAAQLAPDLKFVIRSLRQISAVLPKNVRVAPAPRDNAKLYAEGDVCVQPSHYEGLGLQLLECQAAGMPLVTTAGPPMTEANPWRTIPTCGQEVVNVGGGFISAELMTPEALVETLRPLVGMDIRDASQQARSYVESERNWKTARQLILAELRKR